MTADTNPLTIAMRDIRYAEQSIKDEIDRHKKTHARNLAVLKAAERRASLLEQGLDPDIVKRAEKILAIRGTWTPSSQRVGKVNSAIDDLLAGGGYLFKGFRGVKNYSHFGDQGCDCDFGYGPKHGGIVFSIGLTPSRVSGGELTTAEVEDCIWYLRNLQRIQASNAE